MLRAVLKHDQSELSLPCLDQRFGFGCESRFSRDMSKSGKISSMEYAAKAGLCRRLSRRVNITASNHPVKAPRNASVIERLLKVRSPWPVRRNPVYAMATVQRITRTGCIGDHSTAEPDNEAEMQSGRKTSRNIKERMPQWLRRHPAHPRKPLSGTIPQVFYDAPNYCQYQ